MKVKELIEKLQRLNHEHDVKVVAYNENAGCKDKIPYGKPFVHYFQSAYCSKKCCVGYTLEGDNNNNNKLFEVSPDKSLEEYDREFTRYYSYE